MIFSTCQHYDIQKYNKLNEIEDIGDCFICYEMEDREKNKPIKLFNQDKYFKKCRCNGFIHVTCLDKWYQINSTCPICRKTIILNINNNQTIFHVQNYYFIYKNIFTIIRIIIFLFFFYYATKQHNKSVEIIYMLNFINKTKDVFIEYDESFDYN